MLITKTDDNEQDQGRMIGTHREMIIPYHTTIQIPHHTNAKPSDRKRRYNGNPDAGDGESVLDGIWRTMKESE